MSNDNAFCPYVGLQPFTADQKDYFFGRERDQRVIFSNLCASPLTILYGPTGVGKSSVLQAGVVSLVRDQKKDWLIEYFCDWQGSSFLATLKHECEQAALSNNPGAAKLNHELPLDEFLFQLVDQADQPLLIILDQFEEYLLYHPEGDSNNTFDRELARAINRTDVRVQFLISMREDSLSRLDRFQRRIPNLLANTLRLEHLDPAKAETAIRKPLEVYRQKRPDEGGPVTIDDAVVAEVIRHARKPETSPAIRAEDLERWPIEVAYLQMVMTRLWEMEHSLGSKSIRLATLTELGGVRSIIDTHLDEALDGFSRSERNLCARIFPLLVSTSGGKFARETNDLISFIDCPETQHDKAKLILSELATRDVLRKLNNPERFEIKHDVLAPAILSWRSRHLRDAEIRKQAGRIFVIAAVLMLMLGAAAVYAVIHAQSKLAQDRETETRQILANVVVAKFLKAAESGSSSGGEENRLLLSWQAVVVCRTAGLAPTADITNSLQRSLHSSTVLNDDHGIIAMAFMQNTNGLVTVNSAGVGKRWPNLFSAYLNIGTFYTAKDQPPSFCTFDAGATRLLAVWAGNSTGAVFNVTTGNEIARIGNLQVKTALPVGIPNLHADLSAVVAVSTVGDRVAFVRESDEEIQIKNLAARKSEPDRIHDYSAKQLLFDPTGTRLAALRADHSVLVADAESGMVLLQLGDKSSPQRMTQSAGPNNSKGGRAQCFAWSPEGDCIATADVDNGVCIWDARTGRLRERLTRDSSVWGWRQVAFANGSDRIAALSEAGLLRIWKIDSTEELYREQFSIPDSNVAPVFSQDLKRLAVVEGSGALRIYQLKPVEDPVSEAEIKVGSQHLRLSLQGYVSVIGDTMPDLVAGLDQARENHLDEAIRRLQKVQRVLGIDLDITNEVNRIAAENLAREAEKIAGTGGVAQATAIYHQARNLDPEISFVPETEARRVAGEASLDKAYLSARSGDTNNALRYYREAIHHDNNLTNSVDPAQFTAQIRNLQSRELLWLARQLELKGDIREALVRVNQVERTDPSAITEDDWNDLCWYGCIAGYARDVLYAGEKAVEVSDSVETHDTRGLARALTGDINGAITDFQFFVDHKTGDQTRIEVRRGWIKQLRAGKKPDKIFTPAVLESLRHE